MTELNRLTTDKPWVKEYLYFDPDLKEDDIVFEENLNKFKSFVHSMEEVKVNKESILSHYNLPDHKSVIELLSVFKVMRTYGSATAEQQELFFDMLSAFILTEIQNGKTLDDIFEDKDSIALSRLYQVTEEKWTKKYLTWVLYELGAISKTEGPDVFGANDSAFTTYDFLKNASDGKWRPQMNLP